MNMYKIIPFYKKGLYPAPATYIFASNRNDAISLAREKSGLGRFESWDFSDCKEVKNTRLPTYAKASVDEGR